MRFPPSLRGRGVSIPERERVLGAEALRFIRENPGRYLTLCANRVWYTMRSDTIAVVWNEPGLQRLGGHATEVVLKVICTLAFFATWGWLLVTLYLRRHFLSPGDALMLAAIAASGVTFVMILGGNRFNLPTQPYVWVWLSSWILLATPPRGEPARS